MSQSNLAEEAETKDYATFGRRLCAALIDAVVLGIAGFLISGAYFYSISGQIEYFPFSSSQIAWLVLWGLYTVLDFFENIFVFSPTLTYACMGNGILFTTEPNALVAWLYALTIPTLNWLYHAVMESSSKQATFGKLSLKIKVTDFNGNRISFLRATARHFSKIISTVILLLGFLMATFAKKKQALHDKIAGCLVVRRLK